MAEVDQATLEAMKTVGHAVDFVGVDGVEDDETTLLGTLLSHLGLRKGSNIGILGIIPEADYEADIASLKVTTTLATATEPAVRRNLSTGERGQALYLGRVARMKLAMASGSRPPATPANPTPVPASGVIRKVKLNQVLSQIDDTEVDVMSDADTIRLFARYEAVFGVNQRPLPNQEPSVEQLSALKALVDSGQCPYCDFSVFQPHQARIMKRLKFSGLIMGKAGQLMQAEVFGPPDLESWKASYQVWCNALIMLDVADLGPLNTYRSKIETLYLRYGTTRVWSLLYQSDVRARLEHMPRLRLELIRAAQKISDEGGTPTFDHKRPWSQLLNEVASDDKFWNQEFVEPALIVLAEARPASAFTADDARVSAGEKHDSEGALKIGLENAVGSLPKGRSSSRAGRVHDFVDGNYRSNRTGHKLCAKFNTGECTQTINGSWCAVDPNLAHQCSRCLGAHPMKSCPLNEPIIPSWVKNSKGKGKGKKGRGRKGRSPY